ncbi:YciI family protein [Panacagrimonas sp.]|uniref:YciI family protein n=1 Tax=Panacagrimonas sp. TaxID=2480088 RepID=UPI003B522239
MAHMLLILEESQMRSSRPAGLAQERYEQMMAYGDSLKARGVYVASDSLGSDSLGVRISSREGRRSVVDGPFAEAREIVGGYFLLNCATREEAIALAHECPACNWATVEVRNVSPCYMDAAADDAALGDAATTDAPADVARANAA